MNINTSKRLLAGPLLATLFAAVVGCGPKAAPPPTKDQIDAQFQAQIQAVQNNASLSDDAKQRGIAVLKHHQTEADKKAASIGQ